MKILLVEDEDSIREVEKAYLQRAGHAVTEASSGKLALDIFNKEKFDLIILDLNLPEKDGIEICKYIRQKDKQIPIIMVTARTEEIDELLGLEVGADDYIRKPFSPNILVARVLALLRRHLPAIIKIKDLTIDTEKMLVLKDSKNIILTTTQFNILVALAKDPGKVFSREMILDKAYDDSIPPDVLDRTVDAHIKSIRKSIEVDTKNPEYILTVVGKGYKFSNE